MLILVSIQTRHTSDPRYYVYISGEINTPSDLPVGIA